MKRLRRSRKPIEGPLEPEVFSKTLSGAVIGPSGPVRVMVATKLLEPGARGHGADPFSGAVYVFRAQAGGSNELIFRYGTGLCLFAKRIDGDLPLAEDRGSCDASVGA